MLFRSKSVLFHTIKHDNKKPTSLSPNPVNSIFEDSRSNLWIGTVEGGLNKQMPGENEFVHFTTHPTNPYALSHNTVCYLTEYKGDLWIATWGGGLNKMSLSAEGRFESEGQLLSEGAFLSRFIAWIAVDEVNDGLWLSSPRGLEFYDIDNRRVTPIINLLEEEGDFAAVSGICLDSSRRLWVGTEQSLYCIDLNRSDLSLGRIVMERCRVSASDRRHPQYERINCIFEANNGGIWIGTYGNGLFELSGRENNQYVFQAYGTEQGLSDNVIYSICEDDGANLWLSTNQGLSFFSPNKKRAVNYFTSDGLPSNQFYWVAACRLSNGHLMFGNVNGAVCFDPIIRQADVTQRKVALTGAYRLDERIDPVSAGDVWSIHEQDKAFSLSFSALDYISPEKIRYAYRLNGFDSDWTEVDANRRFATYTNLSAGDYTFEVRCRNADGEWSTDLTAFQIKVVPQIGRAHV